MDVGLSRHYNGTARAREALLQYDVSLYDSIRDEIFHDGNEPAYSYFMKACTYTSDHTHPVPSSLSSLGHGRVGRFGRIVCAGAAMLSNGLHSR